MAQPEGYVSDPYEESEGEESLIGSNRLKLLVGAVALVAALGYFGFMAFQSATVYYYTVAEANELGVTEDGRMVRISGKLVPTTFTREDGSTEARFRLTDGDQTLAAVHDGVLPDLFFNEHSEIILEGSFDDQMVFRSQNVIVKCPSKYVAVDEEIG